MSRAHPWDAPIGDLATQQAALLSGKVNGFIASLNQEIPKVLESVRAAAIQGGISDGFASLQDRRLDLLDRVVSFTAAVNQDAERGACPGDRWDGAVQTKRYTEELDIFARSRELITEVAHEVVRVQQELLSKVAKASVIEAGLEVANDGSRAGEGEFATIKKNLGESSYVPHVTDAPLTLVDQRHTLSGVCGTLKNLAQEFDDLGHTSKAVDFRRFWGSLFNAYGDLGTVTGKIPEIFELARSTNPRAAELALEQIGKFGLETDITNLFAHFNLHSLSVPPEYRAATVLDGRKHVMPYLAEAAIDAESPEKYLKALLNFGCEGIHQISHLLRDPKCSTKQLATACLEAIKSFAASFSRDSSILCNKDDSFRAVYRRAYTDARSAVSDFSPAGEAENDLSELRTRVLNQLDDTIEKL